MTDPVLVATITSTGLIVAAVCGVVGSIVIAKITRTNAATAAKLQEIHILIDGQLSEYKATMERLVMASSKAGQIEERDNQRQVEASAPRQVKASATGAIAEIIPVKPKKRWKLW